MPIDPMQFARVPFDNRTAWLDFAGTHYLWHRNLQQRIFAVTGNQYTLPPIGEPGGPQWLHAVQQAYVSAALALGVPAPPDLSSYDLRDPADFASWTFLIGQTGRALRNAAGMP